MKYLTYLITQAGRNFRQTFGAQLRTLLTVSLSVLMFSFFYLIYTNIMQAESTLNSELKLILYLAEELSPEAQQELADKIRQFDAVEKIVFVSQKEAFNRLADQLGNDRDVLNELDASFLPPSVEVYPSKEFSSLAKLRKFSSYLETLPGADKVQYGHDWLERFSHFVELLRIIVLLSGGLLVLTTLFMVSYTIRLTVVVRHKELELLRFMGATNAYIRGPLLIEGFLQGLLGSLTGLLVLYALFRWVEARFTGPGLLKLLNLQFFPLETAAIILISCVTLCTCGSSVTMRRILRL